MTVTAGGRMGGADFWEDQYWISVPFDEALEQAPQGGAGEEVAVIVLEFRRFREKIRSARGMESKMRGRTPVSPSSSSRDPELD